MDGRAGAGGRAPGSCGTTRGTGARAVRIRALAAALALTACSPEAAQGPALASALVDLAAEASDGLPRMKMPAPRAAPPPLRPNAEMAQDILDLAFALESGRAIPALGRFEGPVRVAVRGPAPPTLGPDLDALLARLRTEAGLDVARTGGPAEIVVEAVPAAALARAVPQAACFVVPGASSWEEFLRLRGTPALDWAAVTVRTRAAVFVPADAAPQELRDCLHEELAQALGPLNDLWRLPDSVFNDDNIHTALTGFDMLAIRALNDPALAPGMDRAAVAGRLPAILARLNPAGERLGGGSAPASAAWVAAIEAALAEGAPPSERRAAAEGAVAAARADGGAGREGLGLYALGRLQAADDPQAALGTFEAARAAFRRSPLTAIHAAHADVQLAAFALASGDADRVLALTAEALPAAEAEGNAGLLATLLLFRAEALEARGDAAAGRAARLDGLAWARYGFGDAGAVRARLAEVQGLNPWRLARATSRGRSEAQRP